MSDGHYRTQCRRCDTLVYDGPWIPPNQRLRIHEHHRTTCTATTPPQLDAVPHPQKAVPPTLSIIKTTPAPRPTRPLSAAR